MDLSNNYVIQFYHSWRVLLHERKNNAQTFYGSNNPHKNNSSTQFCDNNIILFVTQDKLRFHSKNDGFIKSRMYNVKILAFATRSVQTS